MISSLNSSEALTLPEQEVRYNYYFKGNKIITGTTFSK
jgi:hypothetical protein